MPLVHDGSVVEDPQENTTDMVVFTSLRILSQISLGI